MNHNQLLILQSQWHLLSLGKEVPPSRADKIAKRLQTESLVVMAREDQKDLVPTVKEWVVPREYLKTKIDYIALQIDRHKNLQN